MIDLKELEKLEEAANLDDERFEKREIHITLASSPTFPVLTASDENVARYVEAALNAAPEQLDWIREAVQLLTSQAIIEDLEGGVGTAKKLRAHIEKVKLEGE